MKIVVLQKDKLSLMDEYARYVIAKKRKIYSCEVPRTPCKDCGLYGLCYPVSQSVRPVFYETNLKKYETLSI